MSKIEWTNETWNPIVGCTKVSEGCQNCYAEPMAFRLTQMLGKTGNDISESWVAYSDVITNKKWNGKIDRIGSALVKPLQWKKPRMIFVCSMGDLFHESVPFEWISAVFGIIAMSSQHTFQLLTKRPERALEFFKWYGNEIKEVGFDSVPTQSEDPFDYYSPLDNIWIGVTAENQEQANKRIPILLQIPAKVRFVSVEPMLSEVDLSNWLPKMRKGVNAKGDEDLFPHYFMCQCEKCGWIGSSEKTIGGGQIADTGDHDAFYCPVCYLIEPSETDAALHWIICGGESGHKARPMHPEWPTNLQKQCEAAGVPFFFKQWGEYIPSYSAGMNSENLDQWMQKFGDAWARRLYQFPDKMVVVKVGKSKAGSMLNDKLYKDFPK